MDEIRRKATIRVPPPNLTPLPHSYGVERLILMPRDPLRAFAYWELAGPTLAAAAQGSSQPQVLILQVLREDPVAQTEPAPVLLELEVSGLTGRRYLELEAPDAHLVARLGVRRPDGVFQLLLESNSIDLPRNTYASEEAPQWPVLEPIYAALLPGLDLGPTSLAQEVFPGPSSLSSDPLSIHLV